MWSATSRRTTTTRRREHGVNTEGVGGVNAQHSSRTLQLACGTHSVHTVHSRRPFAPPQCYARETNRALAACRDVAAMVADDEMWEEGDDERARAELSQAMAT